MPVDVIFVHSGDCVSGGGYVVSGGRPGRARQGQAGQGRGRAGREWASGRPGRRVFILVGKIFP